MPSPLFVRVHGMRRASGSSTINGRPPSESSHIMIVKAFLIIAHGPMIVGEAFPGVSRLRSTVIAVAGLNNNIFMSMA